MIRFAFALCVFLSFLSRSLAYETVSHFENNDSPYKVLLFLSKDCPCSRSHEAHLNQLSEKYKSVAFFGVITDNFESPDTTALTEYFNSKVFKFPLIKDSEQTLVKEYRALKTPHATLFKRQPNGQYSKIYEGGVSDHRDFSHSKANFLSETLAAATTNKPMPYTQGKSLGCYIRRL